jgi:predicted transcriptional regulator
MVYRHMWRNNYRNRLLLQVLARASGPMSYEEVAGTLEIVPIRQVARDLQRYTRFGYVRRWKKAGKYRYQITRRGLERLAYFVRQGV